MTPRKELFIAVKQKLQTIPQLELIDLDRGQLDAPEDHYPELFTAALIRINAVNYTAMTEQSHQGTARLEVRLYTKDEWMDQHAQTADPDHGLNEIDLLDAMAEALVKTAGNAFTELHLESEGQVPDPHNRLVWVQTYFTHIYRKINPKYTMQTINPTPDVILG